MNTNRLKKHYDKLTPLERYSALLNADSRNDTDEIRALLDSSPSSPYKVSSHYWVANAFEHLAAIHVASVFNLGCVLLLGLDLWDRPKGNGHEQEIEEYILSVANSIVALDIAWSDFCASHSVDPNLALINLPGTGLVSEGGPDSPNTLDVIIRMAEAFCPDGPNPEDVEGMTKALHEALFRMSGDSINIADELRRLLDD